MCSPRSFAVSLTAPDLRLYADMRTTPPCHNTRIRAFVAGDAAPDHSIRAAQRVCEQCPLIRGCALTAMTAGDTLDGGIQRPASGVIQAGVICRGDRWTLRRLAKVAGVPIPEPRTRAKKPPTPSTCRGCGADMVPWSRGEVPEGKVMHRGRGFGECCRVAYQLDLQEHGRRRQGLHKVIDRGRHHDMTPEGIAERNRRNAALREELRPIREAWAREARAEKRAERERSIRLALADHGGGFDVTGDQAAELVGMTVGVIHGRGKNGRLGRIRVYGRWFYRSGEVARVFGVAGPVMPEGVFISPHLPHELRGTIEHQPELLPERVA